jgi:hypothetical protein
MDNYIILLLFQNIKIDGLKDKHNINAVYKYKVYVYSVQNWGKVRWTVPSS